MSLRTRLFVLFGGLIAIFALAQGWLVRALSRDLDGAVDDVAFRVSSSLVSLLLPAPDRDTEGFFATMLPLAEPSSVPTATGEWVPAATSESMRIVLVGDTDAEEPRTVTSRRFHVAEPFRLKTGTLLGHGETTEVTTSAFLDLELAVSGTDGGHDVFQVFMPSGASATQGGEHPPSAAASMEPARYIPIPRQRMLGLLERFHSRLFLGSLALLVVAVCVAGWVAHRVSVPMRALASASVEVGAGDLGKQVDERGDGEVETAIRAFNQMSRRLASLDEETRTLREYQHLGEIGELARGLAHSLRNPLHGLGLSVEELASHSGGERAQSLADGARTQIRRIDRALRSFLALSSAGAGASEAVSMDDLARDVALEAMQDGRSRARIELVIGTEVPRIQGVQAELRAIVQALVVNAVEASPEGEIVRVLVAASAHKGVRIDVEDRGAGIPAQVRARLFTPHVTTKEQGSGLGLFLSQRIATTRYGGSLQLEDREGGGTRAVLELFDRAGRPGRGGLASA